MYRLRQRGTVSGSRQDSLTTSDAFEAVVERAEPTFMLDVNIKGIGISLVNRNVIEVAFATLTGLRVEYSSSVTARALTTSVEVLQVDSQLREALYPVVLQPAPVNRQAKRSGTPPCLQASVVLLNDQGQCPLFCTGSI